MKYKVLLTELVVMAATVQLPVGAANCNLNFEF